MKKRKKLITMLLVPLLCIVFTQGMLPFLMLVGSNIKTNLEDSAVRVDKYVVENRKVTLENEMLNRWGSIFKKSDDLNKNLTIFLRKNATTMEAFQNSAELQQEYLKSVFGEMVSELQYNTASGLFLVLTNTNDVEKEGNYEGFWVRDPDPVNANDVYEDMKLERGSRKLLQSISLPLAGPWSSAFSMEGQGKRDADDFFYKPYMAAKKNPDGNLLDMGYWAQPFTLEEGKKDTYKMITYSLPLIKDKQVYGVLGIEVELNYLNTYFPEKDLDSQLNDGFSFMVKTGKYTYKNLSGKGNLYDSVLENGNTLSVKKKSQEGLYQVKNVKEGKQDIYAVITPLKLYGKNTSYKDTQWCLCNFVTEDSIYGVGNSVYIRMISVIFGGLCLAGLAAFILVHMITRPIYRLVESVQGGVEGIHRYKKSYIDEIDELHEVIENLADTQKKTQDQLQEEKKRYQVSVESSKDMFFTYRRNDEALEIVNSKGNDGEWDCRTHPEFIDNSLVHPEDKDWMFQKIRNAKGSINLEFRLKENGDAPYRWVNMYGSVLQDENGDYTKLVGCIHDIHRHKMLEEEQKNKQLFDGLTGFYRLSYGIEQMERHQQEEKTGILALLDIQGFLKITEQYGMILGDVLVKHFAKIIRRCSKKNSFKKTIFTRAGIDYFLIWIQGEKESKVMQMLEEVREEFSHLTQQKFLALDFYSGLTRTCSGLPVEQWIQQTKQALGVAKGKNSKVAVYEELSPEERDQGVEIFFGKVDSYERLNKMTIPSIVMNLLDKGGKMPVILDMLCIRLGEDYGLSNMIVIRFSKEYYSNTFVYSWKMDKELMPRNSVIRYTQEEYETYIAGRNKQGIQSINETMKEDPTLAPFLVEDKGLLYHMNDNGVYSGSIIFYHVEEKYSKEMEEIAAIIQNRMILNQHDLMAQAKSEFLAQMSHEIRTPMNGIIGMTQIALKKGQSQERQIECLQKIESSSTFLLRIINDILDMSKIESGKMKLVLEECDLKKSIEETENLLEYRMQEKEMEYTHKIHLLHHWFYCDELRINQVLINLLTNAVKYTNSKGHICMSIWEEEKEGGISEITFQVQDDGIGISQDKQQLIFQSFEQADDSTQARRQGTGLGLAISSNLVRMMNGTIQLESAPNEGSTFSFTIPLKYIEGDGQKEEDLAAAVDFTGKKVLLVEDNLLNMEIAENILEDYGMILEMAYNGKEAVEKVENAPEGYFDLILMDIRMPIMNGLEAAREIRKMDRGDSQTIPIVAMSANAFDEDIKDSLDSGMNAHISKPINIHNLEEVLCKIWQ